MGIFNRASDIIQANVNAMLDKAEQPEKMIRLIIQEMEEAVVELRGIAATHIAEQKRLAREQKNAANAIAQWEEKATLALEREREDLAKLALEQKLKYVAKLAEDEKVAEQIAKQLEPISADIERLQQKLDEAKKRERELHKRLDSVVVRMNSQQVIAKDKITDAMNRYERYEQRVEHLEAQLDSYDIGSSNPSLQQQFKDLEQDQKLDEELAALKAKNKASAK